MSNENQHWVPKFLIKNFVDASGRVFCLNIQTDEITKPPPKHVASSVGFNEFLMDGRTVSFEDKLEKIETLAAPILRRIVNSRSVAWLTKKQRNRLVTSWQHKASGRKPFIKVWSFDHPGRSLGLFLRSFGEAPF